MSQASAKSQKAHPPARPEVSRVERMLQVNMALLACLGTLVLSMGQGKAMMPIFVILAAVSSVYLVDWTGKVRLNRNLANTVALIAVLYAVIDFFSNSGENQILAIANLLAYLQVVLLYQRKNYRVYGHLAVLSLLQVVVASALNLGVEFGLLLLVYLFTSLSGLWLMFVFRELQGRTDPPLPFTQRDASSAWGSGRGATLHRWPLARQPARFAPCVGANASERMVGKAMVKKIVHIGVGTLLLTGILFFTLPRWKKTAWQGPPGSASMTGFDEEINLQQTTDIMESDEVAFRAAFFNDNNAPVELPGEPYFRGKVLTVYQFNRDRNKATWKETYNPIASPVNLRRLPVATNRPGMLRQHIVLSPQRSAVLFAVAPVFGTPDTPEEALVDWHGWFLVRHTLDGAVPREQYDYVVATDAYADPTGRGLIIQREPLERWAPFELVPFQLRSDRADAVPARVRRFIDESNPDAGYFETVTVEKQMPTLLEMAASVVEQEEIEPEDKYAAALALEQHFLKDERYSYSLMRPDREDPETDPNEDFIANNPVGHCEYFASALTLMLRSQGIRARMVHGYKGGDYNSVGHYYLVRQLHAHAWVEAYFTAEQLAGTPEGEKVARANAVGAWIRFDPTPGREYDPHASHGTGAFALLSQWREYVQLLWDDRVLGLNSERQQEAIYQPVANFVKKAVNALFSAEAWRNFGGRVARSLGLEPEGFMTGRWFNWRAGLAAMAICFIFVGAWRGMKKPLARLRKFVQRQANEQRLRTQRRVPFWEQAEAVLARYGWRREAGQTQREFTRSIGGALSLQLQEGEWQGTLDQIVDAYYRVRFGGAQLEQREVHELEKTLGRLDAALKQRRKGI